MSPQHSEPVRFIPSNGKAQSMSSQELIDELYRVINENAREYIESPGPETSRELNEVVKVTKALCALLDVEFVYSPELEAAMELRAERRNPEGWYDYGKPREPRNP